ncbi:hypothetical protein ACVWZV_008335 [Bradyrhizobium sp. GM5.1]
MTATDVVIEKEAEAQQPGWPQARMVRQNETQGANDVRRDAPENLALDQRLANQPELVIFEIAQAAMHQLGRPGRRPARQIVHFAQENRVAAAHRVARDAAAVNTASNNGEVENTIQQTHPPATARSIERLLSLLIRSHQKTKAR